MQIYASGATPGIIQPGERFQVPVYDAGLQLPWDFGDTAVEFEVLVSNAEDTTPIDWASMQQSLRPSWISTEAWPAVYANLQTQIGATWGDYIHMLSDNATYLARLGERVADVSQLYSFELQQALGFSPVNTVAAATDAAVATPGLSLTFGRSYASTLAHATRSVRSAGVGPYPGKPPSSRRMAGSPSSRTRPARSADSSQTAVTRGSTLVARVRQARCVSSPAGPTSC